jgi:uncharacterized protein (TIGR01777 family)
MGRAYWYRGPLVSASAVGIYGDRGPEFLEETAGPGRGFLADLTIDWENEAMRARYLGHRVVNARIGLVLSGEGGALPPMLPAFRLGMGPVLGDGSQYWPWVHVDDVIGGFLHAAESPTLTGAVNLTAPAAVTNRTFTRTLAQALRRPAFLRVPGPLIRSMMGELGSLLLSSQRVVPTALTASGYQFRYPDLVAALNEVVGAESTVEVPRARMGQEV